MGYNFLRLRQIFFLKIGKFFRLLMRFCFIKAGDVCWNCGSKCGMDSTISYKLLWCTECHQRYYYILRDHKLNVGVRGIGYR